MPREALKPSQALTLQDHARRIVFEYVTSKFHQDQTEMRFEPEDVYLVWFSYIRGSWKAMLSTTIPDGMFYEVTHAEDKKETYLSAYKHWDNVTLPDTSQDFAR